MSLESSYEADGPSALPRALQPLARLQEGGAERLATSELLALLLGKVACPENARRARRLLRRHGLPELATFDSRRWSAQPGTGPAAAARICAAFELGRRCHDSASPARPRLNGPAAVFSQVRHLAGARKEHLLGLYVDAQNGLLHRETISIGSLNTTRSHPREILYPAVAHLALGFMLAHNHPSGSLDPSPEDIEFTRGVQRAAELMGIELYDHLIVARSGYTSMRELGLL